MWFVVFWFGLFRYVFGFWFDGPCVVVGVVVILFLLFWFFMLTLFFFVSGLVVVFVCVCWFEGWAGPW